VAIALTDAYIDYSIRMDDVRNEEMIAGSAKLLKAINIARGAVHPKVAPPPRSEPVARPVQEPIPLRRAEPKAIWPRWYRPPSDLVPMPQDTIRRVAEQFGLTVEQLRGLGRSQPLVEARAACIAIFRRRGMSYPMIARVIKRDHSSIINLFNKLPQLEARNPMITRTILRYAA